MPRTRSKTVCLFAIALVVLGLWLASLFVTCGFAPADGWALGVGHGAIWLEHPVLGDGSAGAWFADTGPCSITVWPGWDASDGFNDWFVPLWPLVTLSAWRAVRSIPDAPGPGMCAICGYSREGLKEGSVCPECGAGATGEFRRLGLLSGIQENNAPVTTRHHCPRL